jgi:hypothetical protein
VTNEQLAEQYMWFRRQVPAANAEAAAILCLASAIRANLPQQVRPVQPGLVYGIGIEHDSGSFGMIVGPTPDLQGLLKNSGNDRECIIAFKPEGDEVIYRWHQEKWAKL